MSKESNNDEIDLIQLFAIIKNGFKSFLRLIIAIITFYKKKAILFLTLIILGVGVGFFIDKYQDRDDDYLQEIIIEPKYNSTKFIYDFVQELEYNLDDEGFLKKLSIDPVAIKNLKKIYIIPVVKGTDVLDNLQERYRNKDFFKDIMEAYDEDKIEEEKFRDFYKHHKLILFFKNGNKDNDKISKSILDYIKSNHYFKEIASLTLQQTKVSLEQNKETLIFVNEYLKNLSQDPPKSETGVVVMQNNNDTPVMTVASLLRQKESIIEMINDQEQTLALDKEVFTIVDYRDLISIRKGLVKRKIFFIPFLLIGLVSFIYLMRFISKSVSNFVKEE